MRGRVRVKVCGLTNRADALEAIALGADALGFNLFPGSKRFLSLGAETNWMLGLPPFVTRVAVLVNLPMDDARAISERGEFDLVQFHGDEDPAYCEEFARLGRPFIKALRLRDGETVKGADGFSTSQILLDADGGVAFGGTGRFIDLDLAAECVRAHAGLEVILAGGLSAKNVREAIGRVRPYAVDVASGVEVLGQPRRKCGERMGEFMGEVEASRGSAGK